MDKNAVRRWAPILKNFKDDLPEAKEWYFDSKLNKNGCQIKNLSNQLRDIAVMEYLVNHDVHKFKAGLVEAAQIMSELFERRSLGKLVRDSYVSLSLYRTLLDVLASGDMRAALNFSKLLGSVDVKCDSQEVIAISYALKSVVEDDHRYINKWLYQIEKVISEDTADLFKGYPEILRGIVHNDVKKIELGFEKLLEQHPKECKIEGRFGISQDKCQIDGYIYVWGIGLVNLCRHKGFDIQILDPVIPNDLLMPVQNKRLNQLSTKIMRNEFIEELEDPQTRFSEIFKEYKFTLEEYKTSYEGEQNYTSYQNDKKVQVDQEILTSVGSVMDDKYSDLLETIGVLEYILNSNKKKFQSYLAEAARVGIAIDNKSIMLATPYWQRLFDVLSAGKINEAIHYAQIVRNKPITSKNFDTIFNTVLVDVLLKNNDTSHQTQQNESLPSEQPKAKTETIGFQFAFRKMLSKLTSTSNKSDQPRESLGTFEERLDLLEKFCDVKSNYAYYHGLSSILLGAYNRNLEKAQSGFESLIKAHQENTKPYGVFYDDLPAYLYVVGIGLANLCRAKGLNVRVYSSSIPEELLISIEKEII